MQWQQRMMIKVLLVINSNFENDSSNYKSDGDNSKTTSSNYDSNENEHRY
jgi:hypothetical protein